MHRNLTDFEFESRFESKTLDPSWFNHEAHLRLAWIHIQKYGENTAASNLCNQIRSFDQTFGKGTKFNRELTLASVRMMADLIRNSKRRSFKGFLNDHPDLLNKFGDYLKNYFVPDFK